ncbi:MAG TPA: SDR family NAD(P)-dependent oxidoreductase [Burkholderiaceae bacterium]|nr:SDR family NAD(P)-dependent oxidoreductase [Burkholderiaceae bacterium]
MESDSTRPSAARIAWVTGGATGIGRATARRLAQGGATVAISGRRADELERTAAELGAEGLRIVPVPADVGDPASVGRAHAAIVAAHGPVTVLVTAAGTNVPNRAWSAVTPDAFERVVRTNLLGAANAVHAALPGMRAAGGGTIVVISSFAAWAYKDFPGVAYSASKTALGPLVQSLNDEEGRHGVRACHLCPGEVATPILKARPVPPSDEEVARMLRPEDVAASVAHVVDAPAHVCLAEVVIAPTWNRFYLGGEDLKRRG